jgi:hypothetical protein
MLRIYVLMRQRMGSGWAAVRAAHRGTAHWSGRHGGYARRDIPPRPPFANPAGTAYGAVPRRDCEFGRNSGSIRPRFERECSKESEYVHVMNIFDRRVLIRQHLRAQPVGPAPLTLTPARIDSESAEIQPRTGR